MVNLKIYSSLFNGSFKYLILNYTLNRLSNYFSHYQDDRKNTNLQYILNLKRLFLFCLRVYFSRFSQIEMKRHDARCYQCLHNPTPSYILNRVSKVKTAYYNMTENCFASLYFILSVPCIIHSPLLCELKPDALQFVCRPLYFKVVSCM